jgi:hypothetical protein
LLENQKCKSVVDEVAHIPGKGKDYKHEGLEATPATNLFESEIRIVLSAGVCHIWLGLLLRLAATVEASIHSDVWSVF